MPTLFDALKAGELSLANRLAMAPMARPTAISAIMSRWVASPMRDSPRESVTTTWGRLSLAQRSAPRTWSLAANSAVRRTDVSRIIAALFARSAALSTIRPALYSANSTPPATASDGRFEDGAISEWTGDALRAIDRKVCSFGGVQRFVEIDEDQALMLCVFRERFI